MIHVYIVKAKSPVQFYCIKSRCDFHFMHDNLLKLYMDKEKATVDNILTSWYCKILTRKAEKLNEMKSDRTFALDYSFILTRLTAIVITKPYVVGTHLKHLW